MTDYKAKFKIGQIVHHKLFDYSGVVFDIDPFFQSSDEWYEQVAQSRPPKNKPWYHVLVHTAEHTTYVAEQNLDLEKQFFLLIELIYSLFELKSSPVFSIFFSVLLELPEVDISQCCCLETCTFIPILINAFCIVAASLSVITISITHSVESLSGL